MVSATVGLLVPHLWMGVNSGAFIGMGAWALVRLGWALHSAKKETTDV